MKNNINVNTKDNVAIINLDYYNSLRDFNENITNNKTYHCKLIDDYNNDKFVEYISNDKLIIAQQEQIELLEKLNKVLKKEAETAIANEETHKFNRDGFDKLQSKYKNLVNSYMEIDSKLQTFKDMSIWEFIGKKNEK